MFRPALTLLSASLLPALAQTPPELSSVRPDKGPVTRFITLPGTIRANQQTTLYAKVPGYLTTLAVDRGDSVKAGQVLATLDSPELTADLNLAKGNLLTATLETKRLTTAATSGKDIITKEDLEAAAGRQRTAEAALEHAEAMCSYRTITAPFDGIITTRYTDPGAFIPAATNNSPASASVVTLADFQTVRLHIPVPELESTSVDIGESVLFTTEGQPGQTIEAKVTRIAYALDEATRTMPVEAALPNPGLKLRPGMYISARIGIEQHPNVLRVPAAAVVMEKTNAFVFVHNAGKVKKTSITIGFNDGTNTEILTGLTGSETLVLPGKTALTDGHAVTLK